MTKPVLPLFPVDRFCFGMFRIYRISCYFAMPVRASEASVAFIWPRRHDATCARLGRYHAMAMSNEEIFVPNTARAGRTSGAPFRGRETRGPIIDQEGREIPAESLGPQFRGFRFDFGNANANPFGNLTREQWLGRLGAIAKLCGHAFL